MLLECTRVIPFDAGHRVIGHKHKCKYLHGHRYTFEITVQSDKLNGLGMVIDFSDLKTNIKGWIDNNFDHNVILCNRDKELGDYVSKYTGQNVYYLDNNPTAENIALHFKNILPKLFNHNSYNFTKVKLYETPNSFVEIKD